VYAANGKLKPLCAFVDGKQEHHREGVYHLRYLKAGKRVWENGYCESFNCKLRDQFLNGEIFYSPKEVPVLAEGWRVYYNTRRPHSSLGYRPTAPAAWQAETTMGLGKEESKEHFPPSLTPDYGGGLTNSPTDRPRVFLTTANVSLRPDSATFHFRLSWAITQNRIGVRHVCPLRCKVYTFQGVRTRGRAAARPSGFSFRQAPGSF
jgi:hypothetical protein